MKRIIALMLALVMVLGMVGCGESENIEQIEADIETRCKDVAQETLNKNTKAEITNDFQWRITGGTVKSAEAKYNKKGKTFECIVDFDTEVYDLDGRVYSRNSWNITYHGHLDGENIIIDSADEAVKK